MNGLSIEELLVPRIEVNALYPGSPCAIGDLVEFSEDRKFFKALTKEIQLDFIDTRLPVSELERMKTVFNPLPWYAKRTADQLPEYVMHRDRIVFKVKEWKFKENERQHDYIITDSDPEFTLVFELLIAPATEQQFDDEGQQLKKMFIGDQLPP